jgi:hypothetical protein
MALKVHPPDLLQFQHQDLQHRDLPLVVKWRWTWKVLQ